MDTPGLLHRQNNDFLLKTSPVNSLLRAGSSNFRSFTWDLLFPVSAAVPNHTARKRTVPRETSQVAKTTMCFTLACQRSACPMVSQSCLQPNWSPHQLPHGWGHRRSTAAPSPSTKATPHPHPCSCSLSWSHREGSSRPGAW